MVGIAVRHSRLLLDCNVIGPMILWDMAARRAARDFAMTPDDVTATIGPREDPEIAACACLLFDSVLRSSGAFDTIAVMSDAIAGVAARIGLFDDHHPQH